MYTLVALFGYFRENDRPQEWQADALINTPADLLEWLEATESRGNI